MYTIFGHLGFKKSEVKWNVPGTPTAAPSAAPSAAPVPKNPLDQAKELLKKIRESNFIKSGELKEFKELLKQAGKVNENKNQELKGILMAELSKPTRTQEEWDARNYENPTEGDKKDIKALLTAWENDFKEVELKRNTEAVQVEAATQMQSSELKKAVTAVVGQKEQSDALARILKIGEKDENNSIFKDLKDTNIISLLTLVKNKPEDKLRDYVSKYNGTGRPEGWDVYDSLRDNLGYSPNGTLGSSEVAAVKNFIEYYLKLNPTQKSKINQIAEFAQVGLATTVARNSLLPKRFDNVKDIESTLAYLAELPDARFKAADILKVLTSLKDDPKLLPRLVVLCGLQGDTPANINDFITVLKDNPEMKARFFENINTAGAGQTVSLRGIILGEGTKQATEKSEKIERIISTLASKSLDEFRSKVEKEADPTKKAQMEKLLAEYDKKGSAWFTGEIKKVAEGAFVNIGKGTNAIGGGVSFEAFLSGLTVSLGAGYGPDNKFNPALVVHYDIASGKLTETEKKIIEGSIGAGTSIFPAVVPFADGSLKATDKLQVYGNGVGNVDSKGVSVMGTMGGAILSLNFLNERKSEIDQGMALINSVVEDFAKLTASEINASKISTIVSAKKGMSITPDEAEYWAKRLTELYRVNGVTDTTPVGAKELLIKGVVESEGEKMHTQEAMNDTDARSFKGFSVGVGHLFGVTFPLVGLYFKEGRIQYQYPELKNVKVTREVSSSPAVASPVSAPPVADPETVVGLDSIDALTSRDSINKLLADGIFLMSRDKKKYPHFDQALLKSSNGDYKGAIAELKLMSNFKVAKALLAFANGNPEKIATMNTFTYGGYGRNLKVFNKSDYSKARQNTVKAEDKLAPGNPASETYFQSQESHQPSSLKSKYEGQYIASSVFATPLGGTHRIDKFPGSVFVSDKIYEGDMTEAQKDRLIKEHKSSIERNLTILNTSLNGKLSVSPEQYESILKTGSVPTELRGLIIDKAPHFIEARAMINGNICANRVESIIFPSFKFANPATPNVPSAPVPVPPVTTFEPDVGGANFSSTEIQSGLVVTAIGPKQEPDTEQRNFRTEIRTEDIQVGPNNITIVDGSRVITVVSGGIQTNISLSTLTRTQAIAISQGQSITLTVSVSTQVPFMTVVSGALQPIANQVAYDVNIGTSLLNANLDKYNFDKLKYKTLKDYISYLLTTDFQFATEER